MTTDVAVVGTGPDPDNPSVDGFAMAYRHVDAYEAIDDCRLVGCADIVPENARAFADNHDLPAEAVFEDYERMLAALEPDVVSVCVPPAVHADIVVGCAESGVVDAVHCEKPMAETWGDARRMAAACEDAGVRLTFNHQRRFGQLFRQARAAVEDLGGAERVAFTWDDFFDNGTHCIDMCNYFAGGTPAEWVIAGLDYREEDVRFGAHSENQICAEWGYEDGTYGLATTGVGDGAFGGDWHVKAADGELEVHLTDGGYLRVRRDGEGWERREIEREADWITLAITDVVEAYREDRPCELRAENALNATRIIFGGYESARRRGRVDFPLEIEDNPLASMVEAGDLTPEPAED